MTTTDIPLRIGVIGERRNEITRTMLERLLQLPGLEPAWFVEADIPESLKHKLYGRPFDYGPVLNRLLNLRGRSRKGVLIDNRAIYQRKFAALLPGHSANWARARWPRCYSKDS